MENLEQQKSLAPTEFEVQESKIDWTYFTRAAENAEKVKQKLLGEKEHTYAREFQGLIDAFTKSRMELDKIVKKYEDALPEIATANIKMEKALKISANAQKAIKKLKVALEEAWKEGDASAAREKVLQGQLQVMQVKLEQLERKVKSARAKEAYEDLGNLANKKETILKERDRLQAETEDLLKRLHIQRCYAEGIDQKRADTEAENKKLLEQLEANESIKTKMERQVLDLQMKQSKLMELNETLQRTLDGLQEQTDGNSEYLEEKDNEIQSFKIANDRMKSELTAAVKKSNKMSASYKLLSQENSSLQEQLRQNRILVKTKEDEIGSIKKNYNEAVFQHHDLTARLNKMTSLKIQAEDELRKAKNKITNLEKDILEQVRKFDDLQKTKTQAIRERDLHRSDLLKLRTTTNELNHTVTIQNQKISLLQEENKTHLVTISTQGTKISYTEKERDQNAYEIQILEDKINEMRNTITSRDAQVKDLNTSVSEKQAAITKVKHLLEASNTKLLKMTRDAKLCAEERASLKMHIAKANSNILQLKEKVVNGEDRIKVLNIEVERLNKEKQEYLRQIRNAAINSENLKNHLENETKEKQRLHVALKKDEDLLKEQKRLLNTALHEKYQFGGQVVKRNDEITLLREKIAVMQMVNDRGETQYNQRLEDIRLLKTQISNLNSQVMCLQNSLSKNADMRQEVLNLNRQWTEERIQNVVLKSEMLTPINVHRWRYLKGKDPEKCVLIQKVKVLQKHVLWLHQDAVCREQSLQKVNQLYLNMKEYVLKLSSSKVKEDLLMKRCLIQEKDKMLKSLIAELNAKEMDIKQSECVIKELESSLKSVKSELYAEKRLKVIKRDNHKSNVQVFA